MERMIKLLGMVAIMGIMLFAAFALGRQRGGKPVRRTPRRNLGNSGDGGD